MTFSLLQLSQDELAVLASSCAPEGFADRIEDGALPPPFVAARALSLAIDGHPAPWGTTFLIVDGETARIIGGCGFKAAPREGRVEVGYNVAPAARGRGAATAALGLLVERAAAAGVAEVLAEVLPENLASTAVVRKAGFERIGTRVDGDGEHVIQWLRRTGGGDVTDSPGTPS